MHKLALPSRSRQCGFSLMELMIAIVVVGILASIAYPSFMGAIRKSRRAEAISALNQLQQAQERFRANNLQYSSNLSAAPSATPPGLGLPSTTPGGYYTIAIVSASATGYEASATAVSGSSQAADSACAKLGVRMTNATHEYAANAGAWATSNPCWAR